MATKNGDAACTLSVATDKKYNNEKHTSWHTINAYRGVAEIANQYCNVGDLIGVEGELAYNKYKDKNTGQDVMRAVVMCHKLTLISSSRENNQQNQQQPVNNQNGNWYNDSNQAIPF